MPLNGRMFFTLIMLAIFVGMVVTAFDFPPLARLAPLVIGIPGIALTLAQLAVDIRESRRQPSTPGAASASAEAQAVVGLPQQQARDAAPSGSVVKRELMLFTYFFGLIAGIILFGFWLTIPVFLILFLRLHERENWRFALSLMAAGTAILYLVFDRMLSIILHQGFVTLAVRDWLTG